MTRSREDDYLETADRIAARICRDALWAGERCNWLGPSTERVGNRTGPVFRTFGPDLYAGTAGIALFLARVTAYYPERLYRMTALGAARHALSRADAVAPATRNALYTGLTGVAYALLELGEGLDEEPMVEAGLALLEEETPPAEQGLDVLSGIAGAIPVLIDVSRRYARPALLERAVRYGQHLLGKARRTPAGWSWNTMNLDAQGGQRHLLGFSHGAAGIAWALLELFAATGDPAYREAAESAFQYERGWFNPAHQNWPDLRFSAPESGGPAAGQDFMIAWCHGAAGIALSRLRAYQLLEAPTYRQEAAVALQTTAGMIQQALAAPPQESNYSLCHGLAGNAAVLLYGYQVLGDEGYLELARAVGDRGVETYQREGLPWPGGVQGAGEVPGLMLGIAGTGHFYLRLIDAENVAPVVIIPPQQANNPD